MRHDAFTLRIHMHAVLAAHTARSALRRDEAVREYLEVSLPRLDKAEREALAARVPPLPTTLTDAWIGLFLDRLFETVPMEQLEILCDASPENNAALSLAYVMFLESERMEKRLAEDLRDLAVEGLDAEALAALHLDLARAAGRSLDEKNREASAYQARTRASRN